MSPCSVRTFVSESSRAHVSPWSYLVPWPQPFSLFPQICVRLCFGDRLKYKMDIERPSRLRGLRGGSEGSRRLFGIWTSPSPLVQVARSSGRRKDRKTAGIPSGSESLGWRAAKPELQRVRLSRPGKGSWWGGSGRMPGWRQPPRPQLPRPLLPTRKPKELGTGGGSLVPYLDPAYPGATWPHAPARYLVPQEVLRLQGGSADSKTKTGGTQLRNDTTQRI